MVRVVVSLVTGNTSWWKQRKYRRETAHRLRRLRADGWRLTGLERLPPAGVDTRRRTAYHLVRSDLAGAGALTTGSSRPEAGIHEQRGKGGTRGEDRAIP